jgi:hypothetical protein
VVEPTQGIDVDPATRGDAVCRCFNAYLGVLALHTAVVNVV